MAAAPERSDREESQELEPSVDEKSIITENSATLALVNEDAKLASSVPLDSSAVDLSRDSIIEVISSNAIPEHNAGYPSNVYHPQPQQLYYAGFESPGTEWEDFRHYVNLEGLDLGSPVVYNEDPTLMYHPGYGYSPQMPYGQFSPVTSPLPQASGDSQIYSAQPFSYSSPYYHSPNPHGVPYLSSPTAVSQGDHQIPAEVMQGCLLADTMNSSSMMFRPRSADWPRSSDGSALVNQLPSPVPSPRPLGVSGSFGQSAFPLYSGMAAQNSRSFYNYGSSNNSYGIQYSSSGTFPHLSNYTGSMTSIGISCKGSVPFDKNHRHSKGSSLICSCNGSLDFLNEQNRGPRAARPKKQTLEQNSSEEDRNDNSLPGVDREIYNRPDFQTEYENAKFFIIKSYSEDNVHKSIKYNVWASTANGNRKLDSAYHEAISKENSCPVFLFFSVNASAQFCGVAEMIGPVDFEKSVNYWQQDKWTGQFPVKWHIVKDVPNNLLRHIILENNDNKPVTNSRDTQEVKLSQGLEMLKIFKNHDDDTSILDDFDFYEEREKAMQENKLRQQQQLNPAVAEPQRQMPMPVSLVTQVTKDFAQAVHLQEISDVSSSVERSGSGDRPDVSANPKETESIAAAN